MRSRDLFTASKNMFVNSRDLLVIFDPTNGINTNNHLLLPINSPSWGGGGTFGLLLTCSLGLLSPHSISSLVCSGGKPQQLAPTVLGTSYFSFRDMMILRWSEV